MSSEGLYFKILLAGEDGVGKTSLIIRFIANRFEDSSSPKSIEGDYVTTKLDLFGAPVKIQIQDFTGIQWPEVVSFHVKDNDGILVILDVSSKAKMKPYLDYWLKSIRQVNASIPVVVVGNKNDLSIKININKTAQYVSQLGSNFIETSAKSGENVGYAFKLLTSEIVKHKAAVKKRSEGRREDGLDAIFSRYNI
ncbi:MAG: GTP-binding protein [Candidatus Helarchaeota archaeon]|nr:GTP-binding protein [Candidatus Helarchaeota archaeon]